MELIIKPTGKCNFSCTFCSASNLDILHPIDGKVPSRLKDLILKLNPSKIIVTGGEPLTIKKNYYYELHELTHKPISVTSNLKNFYKDPIYWKELFNEEWFYIVTSFHYGNNRLWDKDTVYDEEMFLSVMNIWNRFVNKPIPYFISVIDDTNSSLAIDNVLLAKKLNTKVRLNSAIRTGSQLSYFPKYKLFKIYFDIIDLGLDNYEINISQRHQVRCSLTSHFKCQESIRCCYINKENEIIVSTCDEGCSKGFLINSKNIKDIYKDNTLISPKCLYCDLCTFCNGCRVHKDDAINDPLYCDEMTKIKDKIIDYGWNIYGTI